MNYPSSRSSDFLEEEQPVAKLSLVMPSLLRPERRKCRYDLLCMAGYNILHARSTNTSTLVNQHIHSTLYASRGRGLLYHRLRFEGARSAAPHDFDIGFAVVGTPKLSQDCHLHDPRMRQGRLLKWASFWTNQLASSMRGIRGNNDPPRSTATAAELADIIISFDDVAAIDPSCSLTDV